LLEIELFRGINHSALISSNVAPRLTDDKYFSKCCSAVLEASEEAMPEVELRRKSLSFVWNDPGAEALEGRAAIYRRAWRGKTVAGKWPGSIIVFVR
jgi:hypothetical protein